MSSLPLVLVEQDEAELNIDTLKIETATIPVGADKIAPPNSSSQIGKDEEVIEDVSYDRDNYKDGLQTSVSSKESEEPILMRLEAADDDDEGFKTPTSLDHKIAITECPPAPKKTRAKRKAYPLRRVRMLDFDEEDDTDRSIKKVRMEDSDELS